MTKNLFIFAALCVAVSVTPCVLRELGVGIHDGISATLAVAGCLGLIFNDKIIKQKSK